MSISREALVDKLGPIRGEFLYRYLDTGDKEVAARVLEGSEDSLIIQANRVLSDPEVLFLYNKHKIPDLPDIDDLLRLLASIMTRQDNEPSVQLKAADLYIRTYVTRSPDGIQEETQKKRNRAKAAQMTDEELAKAIAIAESLN